MVIFIENVCKICGKTFKTRSALIKYNTSIGKNTGCYCSHACQIMSLTKSSLLKCACCGVDIVVKPNVIQKSKTGNFFCAHPCAAKYMNAHKTKGTRRSKLEKWLETQLVSLYPTLDVKYNDKDTINSELDIYIPSLNIAFELNGIFHYEPIYGQEKLSSIQNNDDRKFQACLERGIEMVIIDTSGQKYRLS